MKILLATDLYLPIVNGVVTSTHTLATELENRGHEVRVLTLSQNGKKYFSQNTYHNKSFNLEFVYPNCRGSLSLDKDYWEEILLWKPDIVHTQCEFSTYLFSKNIAGILDIPLIHTYHTSYEDYTHYLYLPKKIGKKFVAFMVRHMLKPFASIIVPTTKIQAMLEAYGVKNPMVVIPTGVDIKTLDKTPSQAEIHALKESLNIPLEKKVLVSIGRLAKEKNTELLLEYTAKLSSDWVLVVVGGGPYQEVLEKKATELKITHKVCFTGMIENKKIGAYYNLGDIFVCASTSETQGLTYIEALACGLPLVCKYDTCLDNVLIPEENGFFFNSFEEFEKAVETIKSNPDLNTRMKKHAVQTAQSHSKQTFGEKVEALYLEAMPF